MGISKLKPSNISGKNLASIPFPPIPAQVHIVKRIEQPMQIFDKFQTSIPQSKLKMINYFRLRS